MAFWKWTLSSAVPWINKYLPFKSLAYVVGEGHLINMVEAVALGSDNYGIVILKEVIIVGHIQPFLVNILIDNVLILSFGIITDEVKLFLMAVELQHDGIATVGQPINAREVAV